MFSLIPFKKTLFVYASLPLSSESQLTRPAALHSALSVPVAFVAYHRGVHATVQTLPSKLSAHDMHRTQGGV